MKKQDVKGIEKTGRRILTEENQTGNTNEYELLLTRMVDT